jgi:hypothetical protein
VADLAVVRGMERKLPLTFVPVIFLTILLLSGCQKKNVAINSTSEGKSELPESTKVLQAADLVGYDGTRLRKSVDRIQKANDKRNQEMEKMVGNGPDQ